jgi:hypothetical protein
VELASPDLPRAVVVAEIDDTIGFYDQQIFWAQYPEEVECILAVIEELKNLRDYFSRLVV